MIRRFQIAAFIAMLIAAAAPLQAGTAGLSAGFASTSPGGTVEIPVNFRAEGTQVTGVDFVVEYNSAALFITPSTGPAASAAGKSATCNEPTPGRLKCLVAGLNRTEFTDGTLVQLRVQDKGNTSASYALTLTNVAATDRDGRAVAITGANGGVTVGSGGNRPSITGVVHGTSFQPGVPDGGWVTIYGSGFGTNTRLWEAGDFVNGRLPTRLDGVGVEIGGRSAYVYFISPTQINVLAPLEGRGGDVGVRVIAPQGFSDSATARRSQYSPGFFMYDPEGRKYVIGVRSNGSLVAKSTLYPGVTTPAKPDEVILLYGTGFGQTNPPMTDGLPPNAAPLADQVRITLGGRQVDVLFAGIVAAGQYQFNIRIPADMPNGEHALVAEIGGVQSPGNAFIAVQR